MKKSMIILATCLMTSTTFLAQAQSEPVATNDLQENTAQVGEAKLRPEGRLPRHSFREYRPEHRMLAAGPREGRPSRMEQERPERVIPETSSLRSDLRNGREETPAVRHMAMRRNFRRSGPAAGADRIRPERFERSERPARPERPGIENLNNSDAPEGVSNTEARRRRPIIGVLEGKDVSSLLKGTTIELPVLDIRSSLLS